MENRGKDLREVKFGRLTAKTLTYDGKDRRCWICVCDCGKTIRVIQYDLTNGHTKSCGCLKKETKFGGDRRQNPRLYNIWSKLKSRCENSHCVEYKHYGGRGIKVCEEWSREPDGFKNFSEWALSNGYKGDLSIDRINNDGGYSPNNCRWVDAIIQSNNKRTNVFKEYMGEVHTIGEWAKIKNLEYSLLYHRFKKGWEIGKALNTPPRRKRK